MFSIGSMSYKFVNFVKNVSLRMRAVSTLQYLSTTFHFSSVKRTCIISVEKKIKLYFIMDRPPYKEDAMDFLLFLSPSKHVCLKISLT